MMMMMMMMIVMMMMIGVMVRFMRFSADWMIPDDL
jgi:hypothetical protein